MLVEFELDESSFLRPLDYTYLLFHLKAPVPGHFARVLRQCDLRSLVYLLRAVCATRSSLTNH